MTHFCPRLDDLLETSVGMLDLAIAHEQCNKNNRRTSRSKFLDPVLPLEKATIGESTDVHAGSRSIITQLLVGMPLLYSFTPVSLSSAKAWSTQSGGTTDTSIDLLFTSLVSV